ncbi:MAG: radical SAM protein [Rickettsiales bacterium]|jgi:radical SAM protein with 4Fe4S-binding SPASM domain|nr:radical SAM protein [Rickettsiales bacterium]
MTYNPSEHYIKRGPTNEFGNAPETPSKIRNVGWTLGNYCPHKCKHCYSASARARGANMTIEIIDRIIEQLSENNIETVNLGGNEPIFTNGTNPNDSLLPYIIEKLSEKYIDVGITTSGDTLLYLYKNKYDIFYKINDFDISLDSPFKDEHNKNRGDDLYDDALKCLEICKQENKPHSIIMTGMNWNFTERHLTELMRLCKEYDAFIRINTMKPMTSVQMKQTMPYQQFYDGFNFLMQNCYTIENGETILRDLSDTQNTKRCPCGISSFRIHSITPDGKIFVSPCVYMHDYKSSLDLLTNDLSDIINSDEFKVFRQRNANPQMIKGCENCDKANICGGGCAARAYLHNAINTGEKSFLCKDPYCPKDYNSDKIKTLYQDSENRLVHMDYLCTWIGKVK